MDFKKYLTENVLEFWLKNSIDSENGGIFTCLDKTGEIYGREKSVWFQGRALWTLCRAYNAVEKNEKYLLAARKIYDFLPRCTDSDGRMFFTVTQEGGPIQKRRYFFSETFAAIGCAEYYRATGDETAKERAEEYFNTAYGIYLNPDLTAPKFNRENAPFKALSPVMILLNTAQCMAEAGINARKYGTIAAKCCDEILHGGYFNRDLKALLEQVTLKGEFYDSPATRVVNPGHSLECAWFLMSCGTDEAISVAKEIIDCTLPIGLDKKYGGIIAFTDVSGKPPINLEWDMKLWWPQCEAIIACGMAYEIFGEEIYAERYNSMVDYAFNSFADRENGEWYGYLHYDNTPSTTLKGNIFKGPFHLPRMLMMADKFAK